MILTLPKGNSKVLISHLRSKDNKTAFFNRETGDLTGVNVFIDISPFKQNLLLKIKQYIYIYIGI
jgi:hypothetical protein